MREVRGRRRYTGRCAAADSLAAEAGARVEEAADGWGAGSRHGRRRDDRAAAWDRRTTVALAIGSAGERSTGAMGIRTPGTVVRNSDLRGKGQPGDQVVDSTRWGKGKGGAHGSHHASQHTAPAAASTTPTASAEGDPRSAARAKPATAQAASVRAARPAMSGTPRAKGASADGAPSLTLDSPVRPATIGSARTDGAWNVSRTDGRRQNRSAGTGIRRIGATVRQTSAQQARVLARHSPHRACSFRDDADGDGAGGDRSAPSPSGLTSRASRFTQRMIHSRVAACSSPGYRTSRVWGRCGARLPARLAGRLGA